MSSELMPRYLDVFLQGQHIGWLCEAGRVTRFVATDEYVANARRPTLSISMTVPGEDELTRKTMTNYFDQAVYRERGELPPFFAGLLPEGALRRRLAATRKDPRDMDDFGVLAAAGEDLPGAVQVRPAVLNKLTAIARAFGVTGGSDHLEIGVPEQAAEGAASLSGIQDKLALSSAHNGQRYCMPVKGTLSDLVAKLPAKGDDSQVFNEYASMQLAAQAGVNIAQCRTVPMREMVGRDELVAALGPDTHFLAVDRFDRGPGSAVHMEDACQLLRLMPGQKYAGREYFVRLVQVLNRFSTRGIEDVRQFFIRQVVNTLLGNSDAHLKNFSVLYHNGVMPELSPAYDIVCVAALPGFQGFGTNVAIDKYQRKETVDDYLAVAKSAGISERIAKAAVKQTVNLAKQVWPDALAKLNAPAAVRTEILDRLATLPLAK
ncbi:regulator [Massilia eurypsychrophila]|uniref:Regulator n=1 Tax=Massilia eurypsychrophila TaxID=1485217 RepID=A0A2G8TC76_9BURK|nr:HipA domain-containing protein [Massilia eurypsychrophila]PIL43594.1 regulator [Massilia eurypsychrophila]